MHRELSRLSMQLQNVQAKGKEDLMSDGKDQAHEEGYNGHEGIYGESSQSPHVWHTHPPPSQRPLKLDMHKFDGSHTSAWLAQMEQYFKLNHILDDATKIMLGSMYFDNERWQRWEWHQRCNGYFRTWTYFTKALRDRFEQEDSYLGRLTKLRQTGTVEEYINAFEGLAFRTKGLTDEFYTEFFISGLKEAIKAQVLLHHPPTWTEACQVARKVEHALAAQYSRPNFPTKGRPHRLTTRLKHLRSKRCPLRKWPKEGSKDYVTTVMKNTSQVINGFLPPQTLKIRGFIKHRPVVVLIDSGSTHNFIHQKVAEIVHCFVRAVSNFPVQIADGGTMKCEGRCENVKLQMGDYQLKTHMFAIHMGGCDIVLGAEWLRTLGPITMDFQELYMSFKQKNHTHTLRGLQARAPSIIISHRMEKLLKRGNHGVVAQFNSIQVVETKPSPIHPEMQQILNNHLPVFDKPQGLPPSRG
eukprot:PITA_17771